MARACWLGEQGVLPTPWPLPWSACGAMAAPNGAGPLARGNAESCLVGSRCRWSMCRGVAVPNGAHPLARGTGTPLQSVAASYGAAAGAWQPATARAHWLRGRGVLPSSWPVPIERLRGDGSPQWRRPTCLGDGDSYQDGGRCLWSACTGWQHPTAWDH